MRQIGNGRYPLNPFAGDNGVIVIAHRGGGGLWPENTMYAFEKAAEMGVDGLETDIHATADGELVISHDPHVDRVTDGTGLIKEMTLAELKQLDAGYRWTADGGQTYPYRGMGLTIPTLDHFFVHFHHLWMNIDIKQADPPIVSAFVKMIREFGVAGKLVVGSFYEQTLADFRQQCPEVMTAASLNEVKQMVLFNKLRVGRLYRGNKAGAFQVPEREGRWQVVDERFIKLAHKRATAVHVWTVDEEADMRRLIDMGVDGLMTDYPDRLLKVLKRHKPRNTGWLSPATL